MMWWKSYSIEVMDNLLWSSQILEATSCTSMKELLTNINAVAYFKIIVLSPTPPPPESADMENSCGLLPSLINLFCNILTSNEPPACLATILLFPSFLLVFLIWCSTTKVLSFRDFNAKLLVWIWCSTTNDLSFWGFNAKFSLLLYKVIKSHVQCG